MRYTISAILVICALLSLPINIHAFLTGTPIDGIKDDKYLLGTHRKIAEWSYGKYFDKEQVWMICRGDFLRDASQLLNGKASKKFRFSRILKYLVNKECGKRPTKGDLLEGISWKTAGDYAYTDHIDQPTPNKGFVNDLQRSLNPTTNMLNYIATPGAWPTISEKLAERMDGIWKQWLQIRDLQKTKGTEKEVRAGIVKMYTDLGAASHTRADYYAHSNFVELALIQEMMKRDGAWPPTSANLQKYHQMIYPYVGSKTNSVCGGAAVDVVPGESEAPQCFPVVTGISTRNADEWRIMFLSVSRAKMKSQVEENKEKKKSWNPLVNAGRKIKGSFMDWIVKMIEKDIDKRVEPMTRELEDEMLTRPTHTHLNKDLSSHPLHLLAVQCAINSQQAFAETLKQALDNPAPTAETYQQVLGRALEVFVHPYHVTENHAGPSRCLETIRTFLNDKASASRFPLLTFEAARTRHNKLY